ncbi:phage portal protein [Rhodopirellula bahusiensis]|uniref:phage portal protein n=1 Tax=Rhodopirellula bahusiensis TaxID=2014065 RepID=UPI00326511B5
MADQSPPLTWSVDVTSSQAPPQSKYKVPAVVERSLDGSGEFIQYSGELGDPSTAGANFYRRWDGARTDRLNEAHWAGALGQTIDSNLAMDLPTLRNRCVHEYHNNAIVQGLVETHSADIVGPEGPSLEVLSDDDRFNSAFESRWREWTEICDHNSELHLDDILRLWVRSVWHSGAWLGQETTDDTDSPFPATMRLHDVHINRLDTPWHMHGDRMVAFGVRRTRSGRPLQYYVRKPECFGPHQYDSGEFEMLPPEAVFHGYIRTESHQGAGFPLLAAALPAIAQLRDYDQSVLDAAQLAADKSGWFVNKDLTGEKFEPEDAKTMETTHRRMSSRAAPPGWEYVNTDATHPTAQYVEHRRERLAELGRAAAVPLMLIRLDSSDHNYSSARFDHQGYCWHIKWWQSWLKKSVLNRTARSLARVLSLAGDIGRLPRGLKFQWNWTPPPQGDPVKERSAERMGLQNRTLTFAAACRAQNLQEEDVIRSWARTFKRLKDAGFTREEAMQFLNSGPSRSGSGSRAPNDARPGNNPANRPQSETAKR